MSPEQAFDEAFSRLLAKKRGGNWLPVTTDAQGKMPATDTKIAPASANSRGTDKEVRAQCHH